MLFIKGKILQLDLLKSDWTQRYPSNVLPIHIICIYCSILLTVAYYKLNPCTFMYISAPSLLSSELASLVAWRLHFQILYNFSNSTERQDSLEKIGQGIGRHIYLVAPNLGFELIAITSSFTFQYQRVKIIYLCQPFCQLNHYLPLTRIFSYSCPVWPDWEIFESSWEQSSLQK